MLPVNSSLRLQTPDPTLRRLLPKSPEVCEPSGFSGSNPGFLCEEPPLGPLGPVKTAADGAFGWGGTPVISQHRCPEVRLSVNRNHTREEKAKSLIDDEIPCKIPTRESEAYRSLANLVFGFQAVRSQG